MLQVPMLYGGRAEEGRRSRRQDLPPSRVKLDQASWQIEVNMRVGKVLEVNIFT